MLRKLREEIQLIRERDPAAESAWHIFFFYPGFHAVLHYRISHWFYRRKMKAISWMISWVSRMTTGIEIHPNARIGKGLFIDHGMGVVIGETVEIGDYVTIYQGATLGGTGNDTGKRHPTIGNHVIVSAGAKVLGPFKVGDYAKVGAGAVVLKEVPPHSTVVGIPGKVIKKGLSIVKDASGVDLDHARSPDPVDDQIKLLHSYINQLEQRLQQIENSAYSKVL